jgi:(1->4)-alpha-D-glucan 1-alpha-D-glucosylmutase
LKVPTATYRLQLNADFRLSHVRELISYFSALGVSHLYLSPIFQARPHSPHGYDITNPGQINREIGDEAEFMELSAALRAVDIGIILDIVPNHMAADADNPWWRDVLEHGPASLAARFFDIAWDPPAPAGRVVLPVLGQDLSDVIAANEIRVVERNGELSFQYFKRSFPLDPATYDLVLAPVPGAQSLADEASAIGPRRAMDPDAKQQRRDDGLALKRRLREWLASDRHNLVMLTLRLQQLSPAELLALHEQQAYSLEFWRTGTKRLNYRRFFDVNDLAAVRVEDGDVFVTTHALTLELIRAGQIDGVRVDHVDGLRDPARYLQNLRAAIDDSYVVVEKILAPTEDLPDYWPIEGTTGYDFLGIVTGLFCNAEGLARLHEHYVRRASLPAYSDIVYENKKLVIHELFAAELRSLTTTLARAIDAMTLQFDHELIAACITEVTACMHVYRTYIDEEVDSYDRAVIKHAVNSARHRVPHLPEVLFSSMRNLLVGEDIPPDVEDLRTTFIADWQQFTGPVTAKGLEDTAFYAYNRLIAQCEVGAQPDAQLASATEFHAAVDRRARRWPYAMNASSTHDTKRSEDVRARIAVLSEMPDDWDAAFGRWSEAAEQYRSEVDGMRFPTVNDQFLIHQTLVGVWPLDGNIEALLPRLRTFLQKAAREAKTWTSWTDPNEAYENALYRYADQLLLDQSFVDDFARFHEPVAWFGALNSLSQLTLKLCAPGLPDFYRGNESWRFELVDPDNRRPVDFSPLRDVLASLPQQTGATEAETLLREWKDGRIKLYVTRAGLQLRRNQPQLFQNGDYVPIEVRGRLSDQVIAFARRQGDAWAVIVVGRFFSKLLPRPFGEVWRGTQLILPANAPVSWRNAFTNEVTDGSALETVFATLPFAVLSGVS